MVLWPRPLTPIHRVWRRWWYTKQTKTQMKQNHHPQVIEKHTPRSWKKACSHGWKVGGTILCVSSSPSYVNWLDRVLRTQMEKRPPAEQDLLFPNKKKTTHTHWGWDDSRCRCRRRRRRHQLFNAFSDLPLTAWRRARRAFGENLSR